MILKSKGPGSNPGISNFSKRFFAGVLFLKKTKVMKNEPKMAHLKDKGKFDS